MVSMLAIGSKVHGFRPGQGDGVLTVIKIHSTPSFGGEVKLLAPHRKIFMPCKNTLNCTQRYFEV
jgi:hypothetical protein